MWKVNITDEIFFFLLQEMDLKITMTKATARLKTMFALNINNKHKTLYSMNICLWLSKNNNFQNQCKMSVSILVCKKWHLKKYFNLFSICLLKSSIGKNCKYSLQPLYKVSLQITSRSALEIYQLNFFPVKWSLDREVMKAVLRKYHFLIMMASGLLCYHLAIRVILSWHVPNIFEPHYMDTLSVRCLAPLFMLPVTATTILGDFYL